MSEVDNNVVSEPTLEPRVAIYVDDSPGDRHLFEAYHGRSIRESGLELHVFTNPHDAIEALRALGRRVMFIVTDLNMNSDTDAGHRVARAARQADIDYVVINTGEPALVAHKLEKDSGIHLVDKNEPHTLREWIAGIVKKITPIIVQPSDDIDNGITRLSA